jgi:hypothetical protein
MVVIAVRKKVSVGIFFACLLPDLPESEGAPLAGGWTLHLTLQLEKMSDFPRLAATDPKRTFLREAIVQGNLVLFDLRFRRRNGTTFPPHHLCEPVQYSYCLPIIIHTLLRSLLMSSS